MHNSQLFELLIINFQLIINIHRPGIISAINFLIEKLLIFSGARNCFLIGSKFSVKFFIFPSPFYIYYINVLNSKTNYSLILDQLLIPPAISN